MLLFHPSFLKWPILFDVIKVIIELSISTIIASLACVQTVTVNQCQLVPSANQCIISSSTGHCVDLAYVLKSDWFFSPRIRTCYAIGESGIRLANHVTRSNSGRKEPIRFEYICPIHTVACGRRYGALIRRQT